MTNTQIYNRLWGDQYAGIKSTYFDPKCSLQVKQDEDPVNWFRNCGGIVREREILEETIHSDRTKTVKMSAEKSSFIEQVVTGKRSGLLMVSLRDFLFYYRDELEDYYGESFTPEDGEKWCHDNAKEVESRYMILCMVDFSKKIILTKSGLNKKMKKVGSSGRKKIKHRYSYENPMNRIHGFIILRQEIIDHYPGKKVMSISVIASSPFSNKKGVGSDMMDITISLVKDCEFDDIILEVANDVSGTGYDDEEDDEEDEEGMEEIWYPDEGVLEIISHELWRKTMRKPEGNQPYYNIEKKYIKEEVENYMFHTFICPSKNHNEDGEGIWLHIPEPIEWYGTTRIGGGRCSNEQSEKKTTIAESPEDYEYGGKWYQEGKESQEKLVKFYEKFGFLEDPSVYFDWEVFGEIPYPTMRLNFNGYKW